VKLKVLHPDNFREKQGISTAKNSSKIKKKAKKKLPKINLVLMLSNVRVATK